jgi:hypothetical protein
MLVWHTVSVSFFYWATVGVSVIYWATVGVCVAYHVCFSVTAMLLDVPTHALVSR